MPIRISGLTSGLDTEQIVGALVSAYSYKKEKYTKAQTKLSWKQDAWKTLNSKVYSLYTSVGSMRYSSNYSTKKTTVSDTTKAKATAGGEAINGTQELEISKLAKTAYVTGAKVDDKITASSNLAQLGITTGSATGKASIQVRTNTGVKTIDVEGTTTVSSFVNMLNEAGVQASFDEKNHRFFISSKTSGLAGDFSLSANNELGLTALTKLGLLSNSEINSITSTATGAGLVQKHLTLDDGVEFTNDKAGYQSLLQQLKSISVKAEADRTDKEKQLLIDAQAIAKKYANAEYKITITNEEGNETTETGKYGTVTTTGEGNEATTSYSIDWSSLSNEKMEALAEQMYKDAKYDDTAKTATSQEITTSINTVRDWYVKIAKIQSSEYEDENKKAIELAEAKLGLQDALADPTNKKWVDYIEKEFGAVNSDSDQSYSNFWVQSDNLELSKSVYYRVDLSAEISLNNKKFTVDENNQAYKVDGQDAVIKLNGVQYTSNTNTVTVNGLSIEALAETTQAITISVSNDTDAIYDKVKDFLNQYNNLMNEMQKLYNADSAKDYEPLTDDEKAEMSESEIEKWEQKIKDSLLRRDNSLSSIISTMTMAMMKTYTVNGQTVSWSTYGIHTLGTLNAEKNEGYAYHIDGDSEDSKVSGNKEKLRAALAEDPDQVIDFLKQMTSGLYSAMDAKMKSNSVKSVYTVYNDKEMASEYSNYSKLIKQWADRVTDMEDSYYKKFSQMESALAKLQSSSSSISSLLGM